MALSVFACVVSMVIGCAVPRWASALSSGVLGCAGLGPDTEARAKAKYGQPIKFSS
jgi:hypothetical protein